MNNVGIFKRRSEIYPEYGWAFLKFLNYGDYYLFGVFLSKRNSCDGAVVQCFINLIDLPSQLICIEGRVGIFTVSFSIAGKDWSEENKNP